ncbi:MAG: hypothetical protein KBG60_02845 [Anaerolineaceae bacterium]|nr:hypothetical protein [Anaerolineaceae bacterium]
MSKLQTEFVSLDDIQVAYCQHGSGKALILLHGNSGKLVFDDAIFSKRGVAFLWQ